jgi:hypothetical protein
MRRTTIFPRAALTTAIAILSAGCASAPLHSTPLSIERVADAKEPPRYGRSSDVLTATELLDARVTTTAAGVRQLRPNFLQGMRAMTGTGMADVAPSVYLNGGYVGGVDALDAIGLDAVEEIRLIRPAQAHDFWGSSCPCNGGVILVRTKRDSRLNEL